MPLCNRPAKSTQYVAFVCFMEVGSNSQEGKQYTQIREDCYSGRFSPEQYFQKKTDPNPLLLAEAQSKHVQELLCRPVRDLLPQISTRSQMRDRCSRQPVDTERGVRLLITATWVMEPLFFMLR